MEMRALHLLLLPLDMWVVQRRAINGSSLDGYIGIGDSVLANFADSRMESIGRSRHGNRENVSLPCLFAFLEKYMPLVYTIGREDKLGKQHRH